MQIKNRFETDPPKAFDDFLMKINKTRLGILWNTSKLSSECGKNLIKHISDETWNEHRKILKQNPLEISLKKTKNVYQIIS